MDAGQLTHLAAEALWLALTLMAPVLAVTFVVSLAVSALQAVTQVQDAHVAVAPRLVAGVVTLWLTAGWMGARLTQFASALWAALPHGTP